MANPASQQPANTADREDRDVAPVGWDAFTIALTTTLAGLPLLGFVVLGLPSPGHPGVHPSELPEPSVGAMPYVQVVRRDDGVFRLEVSSLHYVSQTDGLTTEQEFDLLATGWMPPKAEHPEYPLAIPNFHRWALDCEGAANVITMALRDTLGVPSVGWLSLDGWGVAVADDEMSTDVDIALLAEILDESAATRNGISVAPALAHPAIVRAHGSRFTRHAEGEPSPAPADRDEVAAWLSPRWETTLHGDHSSLEILTLYGPVMVEVAPDAVTLTVALAGLPGAPTNPLAQIVIGEMINAENGSQGNRYVRVYTDEAGVCARIDVSNIRLDAAVVADGLHLLIECASRFHDRALALLVQLDPEA